MNKKIIIHFHLIGLFFLIASCSSQNDLLNQVIKYGLKSLDPEYNGKMIGNKNLSDKDIEYILEYMKSYWPDEILNNYEYGF